MTKIMSILQTNEIQMTSIFIVIYYIYFYHIFINFVCLFVCFVFGIIILHIGCGHFSRIFHIHVHIESSIIN